MKQDLYLTSEEEAKFRESIEKDERIPSDEAKKILIDENDD